MLFPDPAVTANIYCADLDALIAEVVVPFRETVRRELRGPWSLWVIRYARGGQHLKLRLHGPADEAERVRELLAGPVRAWLAALPADDAPRVSRPKAPAVDPEDERADDHPDRTLVWTRYQRSMVSLGPSPVLRADDAFAGRMTTALAAAGELALDAMAAPLSISARLKVLMHTVVAGITALGLSPEQRAAYLVFHRDWLLRFALPHRDAEVEMLERFERRLAGMQPVVDEAFRAACRWDDPALAAAGTPAETRWRAALAELFGWLSTYTELPDCAADPYTDTPAFSGPFKALNGTANQLGVDMLNEALVYHIVLRALTGGAVAVPSAGAEG